MISKTYSSTILGIDALLVEVEVDSSPGLHSFNIVGLPSKTVEEAKDRVSSAVKNIGASPPQKTNRRIIVNLAPADLKKIGAGYDLAIAIAYLLSSNQIKNFNSQNFLFLGELSLNGEIKKVPGVLPTALMAKESGFSSLVVPCENAQEAAVVDGINVLGVRNLREIIDFLEGKSKIPPIENTDFKKIKDDYFSENNICAIKGQHQAKRAMEIAAAGGHNILMNGSPGSGKTMMAKSIPSILPAMEIKEALEVAQIYSVCGMLNSKKNFLTSDRPFRSPHHSASAVALVGGGAWPRPGEISLAHRGVLFMDEIAEFPRSVLESLRQPLEDGKIFISRAQGQICFPARFILVAAMNPCPCGFLGDEEKECSCSPIQVLKYKKKISGPLLDRLDIQIQVGRVKYDDLSQKNSISQQRENLLEIRKRISIAKKIQEERFSKLSSPIFNNSEMSSSFVERECLIDIKSQNLLKKAVDEWRLSARTHFKILKIARTIADLEESEGISFNHLAEALSYRIKVDN